MLIEIIAQIISKNINPAESVFVIKLTIQTGQDTLCIASVLCSFVCGEIMFFNKNHIHLKVNKTWFLVSKNAYFAESKGQYLYLKFSLKIIFSQINAQIFQSCQSFIDIFCLQSVSQVLFIVISFDLFSHKIDKNSWFVFTFCQFTSKITSSLFNQDFWARLHSAGEILIQSFFSKIHFSIAWEIVGISFTSRFVGIFVFIQIGLNQTINKIKNIKKASTKFIKIHAKIIIDCCHAGLFVRL